MDFEKICLHHWLSENWLKKLLMQLMIARLQLVFYIPKKAFDTVDHNILITKREHYGIRGLANKWVSSYLENRSQYVCINDTNSECMNISCGVPQGSILGPAVFILYVNDMCNVSSILKSIFVADDTNLFLVGDDLKEVCETISLEIDKLSRWFHANKLSLNVSKTNFMILSNKKCDDNHTISINGMDITRFFVKKFIGVHLDFQLNWSKHISVIKNKIANNVSVLYRVRHLLTNTAVYNLYCTLILPYLNYCCEAWGNTYKSRIQPLYIIQKKAIICYHFLRK